jgi:hypothetical protein
MTTLKINKGKNTANILVQEMTIGGIITDENGNDTAVVNYGNSLLNFFERVKEKTNIDFFPQTKTS